jgi:hypothetical protein
MLKPAVRRGRRAALAGACVLCAVTSRAAIVEHDALEVGVAPPDDALINRDDGFNILVSDLLTYDDNLYRLPPTLTNLAVLPGIGTGARRQDYFDTASLEATGQYSFGRQIIVGDFRIDDNRYDHNKDLDNVSGADKLVWYWSAASLFSGQIGVDYFRSLAGFVNAEIYGRDVIETTDYYATGRYQIGPRWAIFAGLLQSGTTLSEPQLQGNDNHARSVDLGTDYTLAENDTIGWEYRFTDERFPLGVVANNDFREDNARVYIRYQLTEKTSIDGSAGYLKREYANPAIESFSGYTWKVGFHWKPTEKILMELDGSRNLSAYVTAESEYFVSNGARLSLQWVPTEKITVAPNFAYYTQNYVGVGPNAPLPGTAARRDTLTQAGVTIDYTPFAFLILELGYSHEKRGSNEPVDIYGDNLIKAKFTFKY